MTQFFRETSRPSWRRAESEAINYRVNNPPCTGAVSANRWMEARLAMTVRFENVAAKLAELGEWLSETAHDPQLHPNVRVGGQHHPGPQITQVDRPVR